MNQGTPMKGSGAHYAGQAMVDQTPKFDNQIRKRKKKRKKKNETH